MIAGVDVSEVFHYAGGPFNNAVENLRVGGRDPQGRSRLLVRLVRGPGRERLAAPGDPARLPGREWKSTRARLTDVATLAELLRETAEHHGRYEKFYPEHHWSDGMRLTEGPSEPQHLQEAAAAADRYMEEALQVLPRLRRPSGRTRQGGGR